MPETENDQTATNKWQLTAKGHIKWKRGVIFENIDLLGPSTWESDLATGILNFKDANFIFNVWDTRNELNLIDDVTYL
jgi:hypothetical protein